MTTFVTTSVPSFDVAFDDLGVLSVGDAEPQPRWMKLFVDVDPRAAQRFGAGKRCEQGIDRGRAGLAAAATRSASPWPAAASGLPAPTAAPGVSTPRCAKVCSDRRRVRASGRSSPRAPRATCSASAPRVASAVRRPMPGRRPAGRRQRRRSVRCGEDCRCRVRPTRPGRRTLRSRRRTAAAPAASRACADCDPPVAAGAASGAPEGAGGSRAGTILVRLRPVLFARRPPAPATPGPAGSGGAWPSAANTSFDGRNRSAAFGHAQHVRGARDLDVHVRRHARLQPEIVVRHVDHRRVGDDVLLHLRLEAHLRHRAAECVVRIRVDSERDGLLRPDAADVRLVEVGDAPASS